MTAQAAAVAPVAEADLERRFGGLRRLYGDPAYARLRAARIAVVGLGGVGSWTAEALARCGVARLVLIDLDHVAESNVQRQVQATTATLGQAKAEALRERIALIHPGCEVLAVEAFADERNWPALLPAEVDAVVDACDQVRAKAAIAAWVLDERRRRPLAHACAGAAGGKREATRVRIADLAAVTHDPLLASLRQRLRQRHGAPRVGTMGIACIASDESVAPPSPGCGIEDGGDGSLNCHGYGSTVTVTATFGLLAADAIVGQLLAMPRQQA